LPNDRVPIEIAFNEISSGPGPVNLHLRNLAFFGESMRQADNIVATKEVENSVINVHLFRAQLEYSIVKMIGNWSS
jgi:hypothetical protein